MAAPAELDVAETIDAGAHEVDRQPPESQPAQMGNAPQVARGTATVPLDLRPQAEGTQARPVRVAAREDVSPNGPHQAAHVNDAVQGRSTCVRAAAGVAPGAQSPAETPRKPLKAVPC